MELVGITFFTLFSHVGCAELTGMEGFCEEKPQNLLI